ncbi:hypothetical protein AR543_12370 [Paenibacillus bovis]|uniref:Uncharacterized protein n=1 Tax=Paenibacillus bovis TaxID=1616788 RepID=A0A172ZHG2_9BACL|nr:hypothetical protein AR543_12370 [Paenibacillus bovis]
MHTPSMRITNNVNIFIYILINKQPLMSVAYFHLFAKGKAAAEPIPDRLPAIANFIKKIT